MKKPDNASTEHPTATRSDTQPVQPSSTTTSPTEVIASATAIPLQEMVVPTAEPEYACYIRRRDPPDDTQVRRDTQFDIEWTLVNSGTQQWEKGTYLLYQNGPAMTETKKVELPRLKPGESYDIALRATAPLERDLQIMTWAVVGPGL